MTGTPIRELIFIFDADGGKIGVIKDSIKKVLHLKGCSLCAITHGIAGERSEMADCRAELGVPVDYKHRNELSITMNRAAADKYPCILARTDAGYEMLIEPAVLDRCGGSVSALRGKLVFHAGARNLDLSLPDSTGVSAEARQAAVT